ncbi:MAG: sigma-70 family RNA polymerase sigma factor [Gemmobacter sp.]|nr:sigma-70 family RNA polymerase sigma factor [Gemmobacter sp.]
MTTGLPRPVPAPQGGASALLAELINQRQILLCDAIRILGSTDRAEDVLQEAALRCLDQARAMTQIERPAHFARRMVRNLAIDRLRRDRHLVTGDLPDVAGSCENPERRVAGQQALAHVDRLLSGCTPRDRQMFLQHRLMGEAQNRLAERFGLSAARVNAIIGRIHGQLAPLGLELLAG